ncbi:hypothetical protein QBC35DRAFT_189054 [Podospora australis]|uniref:Uncharacterized protein n=1 Tax=Podospora australis TaxID=1536484 RepID=A0AAN7AH95_9PEZI|nr:hypothetical protein QBC35DRAFT_189054 [Podospora australis]
MQIRSSRHRGPFTHPSLPDLPRITMLQPTETDRQRILGDLFGEVLASEQNTSIFNSYFDYYCSVVCPASRGDAVLEFDTSLFTTHEDILRCIQVIIRDPRLTLHGFIEAISSNRGSVSRACNQKEKEHVARVVVEVAFAINCMLKNDCSLDFQPKSLHRLEWEDNAPFLSFMEGDDAVRLGWGGG